MDHKNKLRRHWKDMQAGQKRRMPIIGLVGMVLTGVALWDLSHRPASQVKGKKWVWAIAACAQPFGPVVYLLFGRKPAAAS
jgi:Phospholipase_D-nuclease N-terminal